MRHPQQLAGGPLPFMPKLALVAGVQATLHLVLGNSYGFGLTITMDNSYLLLLVVVLLLTGFQLGSLILAELQGV
jgi:uncharacterized protein (DUF697 family)